MLVITHLIAFTVNEYFTPISLREDRDITREVVECFKEKEASSVRFTKLIAFFNSTVFHMFLKFRLRQS